ncbi:MAG: undecaprenyl-diphosphatase UppP [Candidatus Limnocylindrales bacterium]
MDIVIQAIVMGVVQGLTEFLPISSSAHLIIVPRFLGWNDLFINSASFDVMLHIGTLAALLIYFWRELWALFRAWIDSIRERRIGLDPERRLAWLLVITMIPGAALGAALDSFFSEFFHEPDRLIFVAALLAVGAALLFVAERVGQHRRTLDDLGVRDAVIIGVAQALALFPGISRSGITIAAGLFVGLERGAAARFSFLMATPIIAGAGLWKTRELFTGGLVGVDVVALAGGMFASMLAGLVAVSFLLSYLRRHDTGLFIAYRLVAAALVVVYVVTR